MKKCMKLVVVVSSILGWTAACDTRSPAIERSQSFLVTTQIPVRVFSASRTRSITSGSPTSSSIPTRPAPSPCRCRLNLTKYPYQRTMARNIVSIAFHTGSTIQVTIGLRKSG